MPKLSYLSVVNYVHNSDYIYDSRKVPNPFHSIILVENGCVNFHVDENIVIQAKKGDILFIPMRARYFSTRDNSPCHTYINIHFIFDFPTPFPDSTNSKTQKINLDNPQNSVALFQKIYTEYKEKGTCFSVLGLFYTILDMVYPKIRYTNKVYFDDRIVKAINYINEHYTEDFSISTLAKLSNMSESYFYSCFKKQLGYTVLEYKHLLSIQRAIPQLIETKQSIDSISENLGFSSSKYFRRIFKEITGVTPSECRKAQSPIFKNQNTKKHIK